MVWVTAAEEQRVDIINVQRPGWGLAKLSSSLPPTIDHVGMESRKDGLNYYT